MKLSKEELEDLENELQRVVRDQDYDIRNVEAVTYNLLNKYNFDKFDYGIETETGKIVRLRS